MVKQLLRTSILVFLVAVKPVLLPSSESRSTTLPKLSIDKENFTCTFQNGDPSSFTRVSIHTKNISCDVSSNDDVCLERLKNESIINFYESCGFNDDGTVFKCKFNHSMVNNVCCAQEDKSDCFDATSCSKPARISDDLSVEYSIRKFADGNYSCGTMVHYSCKKWYMNLSGESSTSTCGENRVFQPSPPSCGLAWWIYFIGIFLSLVFIVWAFAILCGYCKVRRQKTIQD